MCVCWSDLAVADARFVSSPQDLTIYNFFPCCFKVRRQRGGREVDCIIRHRLGKEKKAVIVEAEGEGEGEGRRVCFSSRKKFSAVKEKVKRKECGRRRERWEQRHPPEPGLA